ncbi:uncharacterized protein [Scyliorhinus torazame]|uniref:uncharacterized protein n=1 Tax=Scyliorhinus torazame TaxID=75743 RepID=UPI003B59A8F7
MRSLAAAERKECERRKLETSRRNVGEGGSPDVFCGLQKGFLLRSSERNLQHTIPERNIGGLKKGFLLGKNIHLFSDTNEVPRYQGPGKNEDPINGLSTGPCQTQGESPSLQKADLKENPEWNKVAAHSRISKQSDEENRSKVKLKCKNVFKMQHNLRDYVDQIKLIDWGHPDVEVAINRHPRLHRQMRDPRFVQTMKWFHEDPEGFLQHFEESDEELIFVKDVLEIMGQHLETHGNTSTNSFVQSLGLSPESEEKLNRISQHPEINLIINDPQFRETLRQISKNPVQAQRILEAPDPEFRAKLTMLVSAGVMDILLRNNSSI